MEDVLVVLWSEWEFEYNLAGDVMNENIKAQKFSIPRAGEIKP